MTLELSTTQWLLILVFGIGITAYLSRCNNMFVEVFELKYLQRRINRKLNRWLDHRLDDCERLDKSFTEFNKTMSKTRWFIVLVATLSAIYLPVYVWGLTLPLDEQSSPLSRIMLLVSYFGTIIWMGFLIFRVKKSAEKYD